jgi:hypothetical protein
MPDIIWLNKPSILVKEKYITELIPKSYMSKSRKINAVTRLIILITTILFIFTGRISFLMSGLVSLGLIYIISMQKKEGLKSSLKGKKKSQSLITNTSNPLSNGMIGGDILKPAAPNAYEKDVVANINDSVKQMIQEQNASIDNIDDKLFKDLGENFEFDRSMRQFYSTANTTTPNDQKSFADFCYKDMVSGKEGNESALVRNTVQLHKLQL